MSKVFCERMKGRELVTGFGTFKFDSEGITEVPDEDVAKITSIKGYKVVGSDSTQNEEKPDKVETNSTEEVKTQNDDETDAEGGQEDNSEEETQNEETPEAKPEEKSEGSDSTQPTITMEELMEIKNPAQLKKIAKDNNIDLNGATKKDDILPIIIGALGLQ